MTATLLLFVPIALLVLISGFCFVGCVLNTHGTGVDPNKPDPENPDPDPDPKPVPFTKYSDTDVIGNTSCVAYWPLSDSKMQTTALDVVGKAKMDPHNGTYRNIVTDPGIFPCPDYTMSATVHSAFAPGTLLLEAPGIVKGDAVQPTDDPAEITTAMQCDGAFVNVPANTVVNPPAPFTIEVWALPAWSSNDPGAFHSVIDSRDNDPMGVFVRGFAIWVNEEGKWEAVLNCTNGKSALVTATVASLTDPTHVVLTLDTTNNASLFVNGAPASNVTPLPAGETFNPNSARPLVIGVGGPWLDERMNSVGDQFFPLYPFKGTIQCVAIYTKALTPTEIKTHFDHGSGTPDPAG